jgi:hypothetical protein
VEGSLPESVLVQLAAKWRRNPLHQLGGARSAALALKLYSEQTGRPENMHNSTHRHHNVAAVSDIGFLQTESI